MFSSTIQKLNVDLNDQEKLVTVVLKKWLDSASHEKQLYARKAIEKWPTGVVMRYAKDPFIYQYLDTDVGIQDKWRAVAIEKGFPDCDIKDKISQETVTLFQSYQAQYYLQLFGDSLDPSLRNNDDRLLLLEKACQLGSFSALKIRCNININVLRRAATSALRSAQQTRIQQVEADAKRIRHLFGAAGFITSGLIINNLGACFLKEFSETDETESKADLTPDADRAMAYYHEAVKHFLCAWLLRNNDTSNHLLQILTKGKGLSGLFHENDIIKFPTFDKALDSLKTSLSDASYKLILGNAEAEIRTYLKEEKEPNVTLKK